MYARRGIRPSLRAPAGRGGARGGENVCRDGKVFLEKARADGYTRIAEGTRRAPKQRTVNRKTGDYEGGN